MKNKQQEEVGDLFVTESSITIKLMPSKKSGSMPIRWFVDGEVKDHRAAARDISSLVSRLQGKRKVVRGLTLMTDKGTMTDVTGTGLQEAVEKAGLEALN